MQATVANLQVDFATLKNISPQLNSSSKTDLVSPNSVSSKERTFEQMVQDSKKAEMPKEEKEVSFKKDAIEEKESSKTSFKTQENSEKTVLEHSDAVQEKDFNLDEKESLGEIKEKGKELKVHFVNVEQSESCNFEKEVKLELTGTVQDGKNDKDIIQGQSLSKEDLKELVKNTKKLAKSEEEKTSITEDDIKLLTDNDDDALFILLSEYDNLLKAQEKTDSLDLSQISQNIFNENSIESFSSSSEESAKTFAFDKEGKIIVKDLRTKEDVKTKDESFVKDSKDVEGNKAELKVTDVKFSQNNAEMTLEVPQNVLQNITSSSDQSASAVGSNFQAMLANQIQQNASEFVKAGSIVLRDNDVGSIKLILKPENLGNVKVDLQISDKNITGRIVVASQEAFNAFKDSADSLKQAFINSGFENASFDLAFAGQNASGNQNQSKEQNPALSFNMTKMYGTLTDSGEETDFIEESAVYSQRSSVNIVA